MAWRIDMRRINLLARLREKKVQEVK